MDERRNARRYELAFPITLRLGQQAALQPQEGVTRDISARGLYFVVDADLAVGSNVEFTLTLPTSMGQPTDVQVRARGRVVRVERPRLESEEARVGVAAIIETYDIVRAQE
jgi:hypothetical protein